MSDRAASLRACGVLHEELMALPAVRDRPESELVLRHIMVSLSDVVAVIEKERRDAELSGKAAAALGLKQIRALQTIGDVWFRLQARIQKQTEVTLDNSQVQGLIAYILETFRETLTDPILEIDPEVVEVVFSNLQRRMGADWEQDARKRMDSFGAR